MQNRRTMVKRIVGNQVFAAVALTTLACGGAAFAYEGGAVANGGSISGTVKYKGAAPARAPLDVNKDKEVCAATPKLASDLVVGADGGIQYAVASIKGIQKGKAFAEQKEKLDQKGCEYAPHVVLLPAGGSLEIVNDDGILHNIHTYSKDNPPLNRAQPKFKKTLNETFAKPEYVKLSCDVHGWMSGWLVVQDHPYYAVTDEKGAFKLTDVPPGDYELKIWQEKLGETTQKVTVQPGADAQVNVELAPK